MIPSRSASCFETIVRPHCSCSQAWPTDRNCTVQDSTVLRSPTVPGSRRRHDSHKQSAQMPLLRRVVAAFSSNRQQHRLKRTQPPRLVQSRSLAVEQFAGLPSFWTPLVAAQKSYCAEFCIQPLFSTSPPAFSHVNTEVQTVLRTVEAYVILQH
jgi:hypothetical protein